MKVHNAISNVGCQLLVTFLLLLSHPLTAMFIFVYHPLFTLETNIFINLCILQTVGMVVNKSGG